MMPQIGFSEMLVLGMLALVVLGPRDLPLMMRKFGRFTGKMRAMAWEFRQSFDEIGRQAELEELKKEVEALKKNTGLDAVKADLDKANMHMSREAGLAALNARMAADRDKAAAQEASGDAAPDEGAVPAAIPDESPDRKGAAE